MIDISKHSVKNPSGIKMIICMTVVLMYWLYRLVDLYHEKASIERFSYPIIILLLYLIPTVLILYRTTRKPTELSIVDNKILVKGRTIHAEEIKVIMIMGYFRPTIGIKPYGKKVVPLNLCFRFAENEDKGNADLAIWAETNNVKIVNKDFMRWI
ncbi:hypothetical protein PALU110988_25235 [Paenibacillus lupini]|uniref:hypothetical protein n=1 Tax=Paenibacillus lupini TaxID=1450204 RepID=UPI001FBC0F83|nr:hypothetical protein [Paenibacillus lupini]NIK21795.1 hypothetical protein [Paenibacillus lupini]